MTLAPVPKPAPGGFDVRTRRDVDVRTIPPEVVMSEVLPAALAARPDLVRLGTGVLTLPPLQVSVGPDTWLLRAEGDRVQITRAVDRFGPGVPWSLSSHSLSELVQDRLTPMGLYGARRLEVDRESIPVVLDWWLLLRSVLDEQPVHAPGAIDFVGTDGEPLALDEVHRLGDPADELRQALAETGFLVLRGVFDRQEMAEIERDAKHESDHLTLGDSSAWWSRDAGGTDHVVRIQAFQQRSERTAALLSGERMAQIAAITDAQHAVPSGTNAIEVLLKRPGLVDQVSDLSWHKDCSSGRHSYDCSALVVGIYASRSDTANGRLRVLAGSHRSLIWPAFLQPGTNLPEIALDGEAGDVSLHLSCTLHRSEPPITGGRTVLYTTLRFPDPDPGVSAIRAGFLDDLWTTTPSAQTDQPPAGSA